MESLDKMVTERTERPHSCGKMMRQQTIITQQPAFSYSWKKILSPSKTPKKKIWVEKPEYTLTSIIQHHGQTVTTQV